MRAARTLLVTSGRFCRPNKPETPHGANVSPGRRSRRRIAPAENHPEAGGGVPAGKAAGTVTINISLELSRVLGRWNSHPRVQSSVASIMNNEKSPCRRNQRRFRFRFASGAHPRADDRQLLLASLSVRRVARSRRRRARTQGRPRRAQPEPKWRTQGPRHRPAHRAWATRCRRQLPPRQR